MFELPVFRKVISKLPIFSIVYMDENVMCEMSHFVCDSCFLHFWHLYARFLITECCCIDLYSRHCLITT